MHSASNRTTQAKIPRPIGVHGHSNSIDMKRLSARIFHIANVLDVMSRAMPDDNRDDAPFGCLMTELATMAEAIAIEVSEHAIVEGANHA